jgi:hypothetical protein
VPVRLFHDLVGANLGIPMLFFAGYVLFVLIGVKCRHPWFEPKDAPRSQPEAHVLGNADIEAA